MATLTTSWQSFASASFSTGSSTVVFYLEARYTSQSVSNNTTNVQTRLRSDLTSGYISGAGYNFTCTYASTVSGSGVWNFGDEVITSGSSTVKHNNDGTKTLSLSATAYNKYWNFTKNLSASVSIPKINRIATATNGTDFNDETNPTLTFTNPAGYQVLPYLNFYYNGQILVHLERPKGNYTSPYAWVLTDQERQDIRDTITMTSTINIVEGLETYIGNTKIGASSLTRRFTFINANPTFNASYQDTNSTTTAITGDNQLIVQNHSTLQINGTNLSAKKSATLSSIVASINGVNYNGTISGTTATFNIGALNISNNINATITLTDSRGLTAVNTLPITILEYSQPSAIISLARENNFYSTTNIKVEANYSSLDSHNVITIKTRYKKTTDANYGAYVTLTDGVTSQLTLDNNYQWDVQVLLQDSISSTTYNLTLDRGIPIVFFDRLKRSTGINCIPSNNESLEVLGGDILDIIGDKTDTWASGTSYAKDDFVTYERYIYRNKTGTNNTAPDTDTTNWEKVSILELMKDIESSGGWVNLTLTSAFKNYNNDNNNRPRYRKIGKTVEIRGIIAPTNQISANSSTTIATIPQGYRPSTCPANTVCQGSGVNRWCLRVELNGNIVCERYGSSSNIAIPTTAWLPFYITYFID